MKLITNNYEILITKQESDKILEAYNNGTKFIQIGDYTLFRGAITNAVIVPDDAETRSEKREKNTAMQKMYDTYLKSPTDVKRDIRSRNPHFAKWLEFKKNGIKSMPQPTYNDQLQARKDSGEKRALNF